MDSPLCLAGTLIVLATLPARADAADAPPPPNGFDVARLVADGPHLAGPVAPQPFDLESVRIDDARPRPGPLKGSAADPPVPGVDATSSPNPRHEWLDIPGNKYPRKHTLYLNFLGATLVNGADNSAVDKSILARTGEYPAFTGGEQSAVGAAQAVQQDVAPYGIRVVYDPRPRKLLPYTMIMIGGSWTDTLAPEPASGYAPFDCEARGQRHVGYTFADGRWSAIEIANTTSQEAGHAWGLDHTTNCGSVMSYCGFGDKVFSSTCDSLCEGACQGPNSLGCEATHAKYCAPGQQNEHAELSFLFGTNDPDLVAPTVVIEEPADGTRVDVGSRVDVRAIVDDDYGGVGYAFAVERDGETLIEEVVYDKTAYLDDDHRLWFFLNGLPEGDYTIRVEAEDHADHVTEDVVSFTVGAGEDDETDTGAGEGSDSGAGDTSDGTGEADDEDTSEGEDGDTPSGSPPGETGDPDDVSDPGGCGCNARSPRQLTLLWLVPLLVRLRPRPTASAARRE